MVSLVDYFFQELRKLAGKAPEVVEAFVDLDVKKGMLFIHIDQAIEALISAGVNMSHVLNPKEGSLKSSLKKHPSYVAHRVRHPFAGVQKRSWVFNSHVLKIVDGARTSTIKQEGSMDDSYVLMLQKRLVEVEREVSFYKSAIQDREVLNEELIRLVPQIPPYFGQYEYVEPDVGKKPIVAALQLCDWQIGQTIRRRATGYFGVFNYNLAVARALYLVDKYIKWVKVMRNGYAINDCHVVVTGDMVNGQLRLSAAMSNEFPVPVQQVYAAALLAEVLNRLACHFAKLSVDYHVIDNHGRRTKKMQWTLGGENSDNYPVAELTKAYLRGIGNVNFNIHLEVQSLVEINGISYLVEHGASVRSILGYPWYGMGHKIGRESFKRMNVEGARFRKLIIGHYHAPLWHPQYLVGGSLPGTSEFDSAHGRHYPPAQTAWLTHPSYGEFNWTPFDLVKADSRVEEYNTQYIKGKYNIESPTPIW